MAKALLGHLAEPRGSARYTIERLLGENARLRDEVARLEAELALANKENRELAAVQSALLEPIEEMQLA